MSVTDPNVYFGAGVFLTEENFGRGVGRRSAPRVQPRIRRPEVAETEIGDLDVAVAVQEQILRLQEQMTTNMLRHCWMHRRRCFHGNCRRLPSSLGGRRAGCGRS